jgi:succinyl-diaminopimelate desuccinylase
MTNLLLRIKEKDVVDLTRSLVKIPSENPTRNESEVAGFILDWFKSRGIEAKMYEKVKGRSNVVARIKGLNGPKLLLNGHIDTVPVGDRNNWSHDPFDAEMVDDRIYGRGVSDMKGGVAGMMIAAEALLSSEVQLKGDLIVAAVSDEEMLGSLGTKYLLDEGLIKCDAAVTGEACIMRPPYDEMDLVIAERGALWLEAISKGKSAHGSVPHMGINAVEKMAKFILAMEKLQFNYKQHDLLSPPTVAVGTTIQGGFKENAVPDLCKATFDIRTVPSQSIESVLEDVHALIADLQQLDPEINFELNTKLWAPACEVSANDKIVQVARDAVKEVTGRQPVLLGMNATTDARITAAKGIPSIPGCGPGSIHTAHIPDEYVKVKHLVYSAKIFTLIALNYLGTP